MDVGDKIRELREARGWSQDELAERVGISQAAIVKIEKGQTTRSRFLPDIAKALDRPIEELVGGRATPHGYRPPPEFLGERDLPVFAAVEGGSGEMVVSTDPIDIVQRPWFLGTVKDGYAVLVTGESMEPAFRSGDLAIVNPRLGPQPSTDVILVADEKSGGFRASIKYLIKHEPHRWYLRQHNPPPGEQRDFWRTKKEWPKALRVVGKYSGR